GLQGSLRQGARVPRRARHRMDRGAAAGPRARLLHSDDLRVRAPAARRAVGHRRRRPVRRAVRGDRRTAAARHRVRLRPGPDRAGDGGRGAHRGRDVWHAGVRRADRRRRPADHADAGDVAAAGRCHRGHGVRRAGDERVPEGSRPVGRQLRGTDRGTRTSRERRSDKRPQKWRAGRSSRSRGGGLADRTCTRRAEMIRTHEAGTLRASHAGERVVLAGWVARRRDHGGVVFLDLRDASGVAQVVVRELARGAAGGGPPAPEHLHELRAEFCVKVDGVVRERPAGNENPELPTGSVEVVADVVEVLSEADPLPFPVEGSTDVSEDVRLRYRYLDIRRDDTAHALRVRSQAAYLLSDVMRQHRFVQVETPYLTRSTPEGARDFLVPVRLRPGNWYALPQSPQLFKQLLMVGGLERYYQLARCFRDEDFRKDRQPEFTQIDIEMSFVTRDDVIAVA